MMSASTDNDQEVYGEDSTSWSSMCGSSSSSRKDTTTQHEAPAKPPKKTMTPLERLDLYRMILSQTLDSLGNSTVTDAPFVLLDGCLIDLIDLMSFIDPVYNLAKLKIREEQHNKTDAINQLELLYAELAKMRDRVCMRIHSPRIVHPVQ